MKIKAAHNQLIDFDVVWFIDAICCGTWMVWVSVCLAFEKLYSINSFGLCFVRLIIFNLCINDICCIWMDFKWICVVTCCLTRRSGRKIFSFKLKFKFFKKKSKIVQIFAGQKILQRASFTLIHITNLLNRITRT